MTSDRPRITLITPTADQPTGVALMERWISRQTMGYDEWIVADDGVEHASLTMGQIHMKRRRRDEGGRSLAQNVMHAIKAATGDVILIIEHDDFYAADHIETCVRRLERMGSGATGSINQRYYNLPHKSWRLMRNVGSALCNTAFTRDHLPSMERAALRAYQSNRICVDRFFWDSLPRRYWDVHDVDTVVGIKGLPGRKGLGLGHRPDRNWTSEAEPRKLREWVGDEYDAYLPYFGGGHG